MWQKLLNRVLAEGGAVIAKVAQEELADYAEKLRTPVEEEDEESKTEEDNSEEEESQTEEEE